MLDVRDMHYKINSYYSLTFLTVGFSGESDNGLTCLYIETMTDGNNFVKVKILNQKTLNCCRRLEFKIFSNRENFLGATV